MWKNEFYGLVLSLAAGWLLLAPAGVQARAELVEQGQKVYAANCASCHRGSGEGLPNVFPSLVKNGFVTGEAQPVIQLILEGRRGAMGRMPAWKATLKDEEIAGVVSFIRQNWGNQGGAVTPEMVAAQRGGRRP